MPDEHTPLPADLPALWRERAQLLRKHGGDPAAKVWELAAAELAQAVRRAEDHGLTLVDAARRSGYTADHLGAMIRDGTLPNAGRKNAPRIRIADLPIKGTARVRPHSEGTRDDDAMIAEKLRRTK